VKKVVVSGTTAGLEVCAYTGTKAQPAVVVMELQGGRPFRVSLIGPNKTTVVC
jgi:hypothetical protein